MLHHQTFGIGGDADDGEIQLPFAEDGLRLGLPPRLQHRQHALLTFREHHLIGRHVFFALRHLIEIKLDTAAALVAHLGRGGGEARRAHILNGDDRVGRHQLETGFEQKFLGERIAHLHGGALLVRGVVEFGTGHGGAVNAVTPGPGADIDHRIACAPGGGQEDVVRPGKADAHRIDQDVAVVGAVEIHLAAHCRHPHAIAITADAGHHALHQMTGFGMCGFAEAQRVHHRDGPRAHREDIAHDAADTGGRPLIGLDKARVIVAFHLEDGGIAIADVDHPGILPRPLQHVRGLGRQLLQMDAGGFIGAMLRPHHAEDAEFDQARLPVQELFDPAIFGFGKAMLADQFGGDDGACLRHVYLNLQKTGTLPLP